MKDLYDVQQLLKRFNIFVYLGHRKWEIELMLQELQSLEQSGVISDKEFQESLLILKREHRIEEEKEHQKELGGKI